MSNVHRLLIIAVFLSTACHAQDLSKNFIEISAGAGLPIGVFSSKKSNITSGLAMTGQAINIEYNRYFKTRLGFCVGLRRSVFPLDVDAWTNSNPNATSEPWRISLMYGGLVSRKRIREKTILSAKAAVGFATSRYPEATIVLYSNSNPVVFNYSSNKGSALAFLVGTSLKYILSERIHAALNLDYLSTSPRFVVKEIVYNGQSSTSRYLPYTQNMQAITVGVSLCYNFIPRN